MTTKSKLLNSLKSIIFQIVPICFIYSNSNIIDYKYNVVIYNQWQNIYRLDLEYS